MTPFSVPCAFAAYFRRGATYQPSDASGVVQVGGKSYVHLFNTNGTLAVYRIDNANRLKGLKRWPKEIDLAIA